jgi:hypothetical protein
MAVRYTQYLPQSRASIVKSSIDRPERHSGKHAQVPQCEPLEIIQPYRILLGTGKRANGRQHEAMQFMHFVQCFW